LAAIEYIIWGATGQALVIEEALHGSNYKAVAIFDNSPSVSSPFENVPIFHGKNGFMGWKEKHASKNTHFVVAIGGGRGSDRIEMHNYLKSSGLIPFNVIHPTAYLAYNAKIGEGAQLMANATVCARAVLHNGVIINTSANVDHECILHNGVHIGPGASLAGCVEVGENTFVGTNATILPRIKIGKNVVIGAGAVITKNIPDNCTVVGNPGKEIIKNNK
jgi:sugar O-acyltransferase (sialic acid O-acetyltransferase NeuD family)